MMERFRQLAPREQMILVGGAALAILIIGWSFVWTPLVTTVDELRESVSERSRLMVDLKRAASLPSSGTAAIAGRGAEDLSLIVEQTARPMGLSSSFTTARTDLGNASYHVTFQNASFALLVDWLIAIEREYGVTASTVRFQPGTRGPGLVNGQVVLSWN